MTEANAVIDRFAPQVRWITDSIMRSFEFEEHMRDDLKQEAYILLMSYADIIPGRHPGKLAAIERLANGDRTRVHNIVAVTLRMDLTEQVTRAINKTPLSDSLNSLVEDQEFDAEDPYSEVDLYNQEQENRLRRHYPMLARNIFDGLTQAQIAEADGIGHATVERRIGREKRQFLTDALKRANLVIEGDESMAELEEAYVSVTKVRR